MTPWMAVILAAALFCIVRGGFDLFARRYVWGAAGILAGAALLLVPIPSHAVKYDLGAASVQVPGP